MKVIADATAVRGVTLPAVTWDFFRMGSTILIFRRLCKGNSIVLAYYFDI